MRPKIWLSEMKFSDSSTVQFEKNDIVVFVGPNNSGKSASLKEAVELLKDKTMSGRVLLDIAIGREGDVKELYSFLESISKKGFSDNYQGYGFNIYSQQPRSYWESYKEGIHNLLPVFANVLTTEKRLQIANPANNIKLTTQGFSHPIHFLQKDDLSEYQFSEYFKQAFGLDLIVHRNAGNEVPLYIGERPTPNHGCDRVSVSYQEELEKLDLLHEQGDGMRSYVGVLLDTFISHYSILFIDEPEAFLHPPQARLLGKMLGKDLPAERQLFIATHSEDFLKGLLDANISRLKIIRIQREGTINKVRVLDSEQIRGVWSDSLLRHSNILSGLFHSKVIICESDSDCRFYSAIFSVINEDSSNAVPDVLFVSCGGKQRIPTVIKALNKLNVELRVVADIDVLNEENPLSTIFSNLGGKWNDVKKDWLLVKNEVGRKRPELLSSELKEEIRVIFDSITDPIIPSAKINEIQKTLKKASAWSAVKEAGKAYIPGGNATQAFDRIQIKFKEKGFFVLEVGELEGFAKSIGNHGPKWVSEVLTKDLKNDPELEVARKFVTNLMS